MGKAVVCEDTIIIGNVTIMPGCVIHTSAIILAEGGPIILGENCIVEEYATIRNRIRPSTALLTRIPILNIGSNNVFEVGCTVEAIQIGEKNLFESKCYVGPYIAVKNRCIIGSGVKLNDCQEILDDTVICKTLLQRVGIEQHAALQIDFLRKVLPNYHHLRKPNYDPKKVGTTNFY